MFFGGDSNGPPFFMAQPDPPLLPAAHPKRKLITCYPARKPPPPRNPAHQRAPAASAKPPGTPFSRMATPFPANRQTRRARTRPTVQFAFLYFSPVEVTLPT